MEALLPRGGGRRPYPALLRYNRSAIGTGDNMHGEAFTRVVCGARRGIVVAGTPSGVLGGGGAWSRGGGRRPYPALLRYNRSAIGTGADIHSEALTRVASEVWRGIVVSGTPSGVLGWERYFPGVAAGGLTPRYGALIAPR